MVLSGQQKTEFNSATNEEESDVFHDVFVESVLDDDAESVLTDDRGMELMEPLRYELTQGSHALCDLVDDSTLDLLEICAPWDSPLSSSVRELGGKAMSIGIHNGYDLTKYSGFKNAAALIRKTKPLYVHISPPCDPWTALQNCNQRTTQQVESLRFKRQQGRKILKHCRKLLEIQLHELNGDVGMHTNEQHHHGGGEQPLMAQSWSEDEMIKMVRMCGDRFPVHGCRHGLKSKRYGTLVKKPWGWFSSLSEMKHVLSLCCNHGTKAHPVIQGSDTSATAVYPPLLCRRFAKVIMQQRQQLFSVFSQVDDTKEPLSFGDLEAAILAANKGTKKTQIQKKKKKSQVRFAPVPEEFPPSSPKERGNTNLGEAPEMVEDEPEAFPEAPEAENEVIGGEPDGNGDDPNGDDDGDGDDADLVGDHADDDGNFRELDQMLKTVHRNLGHPNNTVLKRMLKDAGAKPEVLARVDQFQCADCLQRGRKSPPKPSTVPRVYEKWKCVSVDTFWWHTPKEAVRAGCSPKYVLGVSMMDEATDYHTAYLVRISDEGAPRNMSAADFKQAFAKGWLQTLPAPSVLRYDEEGCLRSLNLVTWLETYGVKMEPIAGEAAWQVGKHSKHLQTLKEQMSLLTVELGDRFDVQEVLSLSLAAKNNLHNIRGYSPNQWAFGQNHSRISSFLQQYENLPLQSAREEWTFEENLQNEQKAQRLFLQVDARRRLQRALHARIRPLREFAVGDLVYYFRKGPREGSRYGGNWFGPARVLAHEKTGDYDESQHAGSVVWISHAGKLLRCSPEQLRHVSHDVRSLDRTINGPQNFHTLLDQIVRQQRYADISQEGLDVPDTPAVPEELQPHFRARGKRPLSELRHPDSQSPDCHGAQECRPEELVGSEGQTEPEGSEGLRSCDPRGVGRSDSSHRKEAPRQDISNDLRGRRVQPVGSGTCGGGLQGQGRGSTVCPLPSSPPSQRLPRGDLQEASRKRKPSGSPEEGDREDDRGPVIDRGRRPRIMGESGRDGDEHATSSDQHVRDGTTHAGHGEHHDTDPGLPTATAGSRSSNASHEGSRRLRSRSPYPTSTEPRIEGNSANLVSFSAAKSVEVQQEPLHDFISYVDQLDVLEMELNIAPRDVHKKKGCWVVNAKAKKNVEVVLRKLNKQEQTQFDEAMQKELDSFLCSGTNHADALDLYLETCFG